MSDLTTPRGVMLGCSLMLGAAMTLAALLGHLKGGYDVWYWTPTAVAFSAVLAVVVAIAPPQRQRLRGRVRRVGIAALVLFAAWTALAWRWSDNQHVAFEEAARTSFYVAAALTGVIYSRSRTAVRVAMIAWTFATTLATIVLLARIDDDPEQSFLAGRMLGTVEYHNGHAAFLLLPLATAISLAALRGTHPIVRALLVGCSCVLLASAALPQSRGGLVAIVAAMLTYFSLSPIRARSFVVLAAPVAATAYAWSDLNRVYTRLQADPEHPERAASAIRDASGTLLVAALVATIVALVVAYVDRRREVSYHEGRIGKAVIGAATLIALVVAVASVPALHSPVKTFRAEWERAVDPPEQQVDSEEFGRFATFGNQSTAARVVLWKAAIEAYQREPLTGVGPGNYDRMFYVHREQVLDRYAKQPHNLALEILSERGIVGAFLFALFLGACLITALRVRLSDASVETKALIAGIVGSVTYWLVHAQFDWLWQLSATTFGVMVLLGCLLGAPWRYEQGRRVQLPVRIGLVALFAIAALVPVPLLIADRAIHRGEEYVLDDPKRALRALERAERWAPWSPTVPQLQAEAHESTLDFDRGDDAIERMVERNDRHWAVHMIAASWYQRSGRPELAEPYYERAVELNPLEPELEQYR